MGMEKLKIVVGMLPYYIVRYYYGSMYNGVVGDFLWENSCYPFGDIYWIGEEVWDYYLRNKLV